MNQTNQTSPTGLTGKTQRISTRELVITGMFTAVICVLSQISIQTQPIPFTLGLLAIFLTGALLSPRYALLATLAYLLLGAFGLPVFAGLKSGIQTLAGPTGGYLMAYPVMAFVTALSYKLIRKYRIIALAAGMLISLALCYLIGTLWFTFITDNSFYSALTLCVFPFILVDLVKIALAIAIGLVIRKTAMRNYQ
jgi:biotin transport system substrate-specific component